MQNVKKSYDAIIIGAGPAGSTIATLLAKKGQKVLVLEKELFPRFHIGESLLPASNAIWDRLGVREKLDELFLKKPGGRWYYDDQFVESCFGDCDTFASFKDDAIAYLVEREILDQVLIENSIDNGAEVRFEHTVTDMVFEKNKKSKITAKNLVTKEEETLEARCVFDCSGMGAVIGKKMGIRKKNSLNRMSVFAHFKTTAQEERLKENWFVGAMIHNGWVWTIPISKDVISIGVVDTIKNYKDAKANPEKFLQDKISSLPYFKHAISAQPERVSSVTCMGNLGFTSTKLCGDGWVLVGDAALFIDPCYSSGVHMALYTAQLVADRFLELPHDKPVNEKDYRKYDKDIRKHEKGVIKLVESFYDASTNKKFRKWVPAHVTPTTYKKFCTVTGGDLHRNKLFTHTVFYIGRFFNKFFPDRV
ncbi:MAG: hypothetical protein COA79_17620 [Planctomycetota bacterium]|nr:MAG: hypothetical protein COA79_17620 [Planctomycetota bacterium]